MSDLDNHWSNMAQYKNEIQDGLHFVEHNLRVSSDLTEGGLLDAIGWVEDAMADDDKDISGLGVLRILKTIQFAWVHGCHIMFVDPDGSNMSSDDE